MLFVRKTKKQIKIEKYKKIAKSKTAKTKHCTVIAYLDRNLVLPCTLLQRSLRQRWTTDTLSGSGTLVWTGNGPA